MDNSSLTGESEPQERFAMPNGSQLRPAEAENLVRDLFRLCRTSLTFGQAFNSTLVVNGEAWGSEYPMPCRYLLFLTAS